MMPTSVSCRALPARAAQAGFSLIEIAIGLVILGLATVGLIATLSEQAEQRRIVDTRRALDDARDALLAFAGTNGRLPCPATAATNGQESIASNVGGIVTCSVQDGFLPAVTLGLPGVEPTGLLTDGWRDGAGQANGTHLRAFRYGLTSLAVPVANALSSPALGAPGSPTQRIAVQTAINANQGLFVCRSAAGMTGAGNRCGSAANTLASNAVAIVRSAGRNGAQTAAYSADEQQNYTQAITRGYVHRDFAPAGATGGSYDDLMTWIPYPQLANRLVASGQVL
ncbi:MAG: type II secretion system protein [Burkholderiaceae bacterium]|nr:type II secretion system protein [Burkholderiaceae bacterium]